MRIAIICDVHMPENRDSSQCAFLLRAVEQMKADNIKTVIALGDVTSYGEYDAAQFYNELVKDFDSYFLLGNAEIRNPNTAGAFLASAKNIDITAENRRILGINTPYGDITDEDRERLCSMHGGDIVLMHHGPHIINEDSRTFIKKLAEEKSITIIHAHSHKKFDYKIGESRIIGLRALDPDKSIGDFPCITYVDIMENEILTEERCFGVPRSTLSDVRDYFGLSCVDNHKDVEYAIKNKVPYIELRCNGGDWFPDMSLIPKLEEWRKVTKGYLSIHMPNLRWKDGTVSGEDKWIQAVAYAIKTGANSLTMHPPRVKKADMPDGTDVWNRFVALYAYAVKNVGCDVKAGIENLHMSDSEQSSRVNPDELHFGYTPEEVTSWIDAVNNALGIKGRVGHILDVGHARNNGDYASIYPSSRWYEIMGNKTVAYHIHQVTPTENGALNHNAIENWFGPLISYVSFFHCWGNGTLNHVPVFLEVQGSENFEKSIKAFERILESCRGDIC